MDQMSQPIQETAQETPPQRILVVSSLARVVNFEKSFIEKLHKPLKNHYIHDRSQQEDHPR